jgi:RecA-family ATPase
MPVTNEQYLAGTILLEDSVIWGLDGLVTADDFQSEHCRAIFEAAKALKDEGSTVDPVTIMSKARQSGVDLPIKFIKELMEIVPTTANFAEYAKRVAEDARKRRIKEFVTQIQMDDVSSATELAERLQEEAGRLAVDTDNTDAFLSLFKPLTEFEEEEATWLIPGWVPEGQITLIAADGGIGKTTLWCHILAALSNGQRCILDPIDHTRQPMKIAFCSTEDSVRKKLLKKLRLAGANMANIIAMDMAADKTGLLRNFKFGTKSMGRYVRNIQPAACIFDPVQGFIPPKVNMGARNEMRDCLAPLIILGEEVGTTFIVVCHTNKRPKAYGRDRIADSADLWDIARSVIMGGYTENQGIRYLSNEKNNYAELQETVLFSINKAGQIVREGTSWKRDKEYVLDSSVAKSAPRREDCKDFILSALQDAPSQCIKSDDLVRKAQEYGYAFDTIKRARKELNNEGVTENYYIGTGKRGGRLCFIRLKTEDEGTFEQLPMEVSTPFDGQNDTNALLI